MTCPTCQAYAEPDRETGYDGADLCPTCIALGWDYDARGDLYRLTREDEWLVRAEEEKEAL